MSEPLKRIAYVEDEQDIQTVAKLALEMVGGYEVEILSSGHEAMIRLPQLKPQLVLMDVMMPGMDGPSTLRAMRENPALVDLPVIFMTAKAQMMEVQELKALGALDVITKPFDPMDLANKVEAIWRLEKK